MTQDQGKRRHSQRQGNLERSGQRSPAPPPDRGLTRSLTSTKLALVALGSIIGAGFFLGSGIPIYHAGRAAVFAYLLGGFLMYLIVSMLAEMAAAQPVEGGFSTYACEYFGRWIGFVSGWMYWSSGVLTMSSEVVAAAIFTRLWLPHWPLWIFALVYSALMVLINTRDTSGFATAEGALSALKLVALALFVLLALVVLFFGSMALPGADARDGLTSLRSFWSLRDILPEGLGGFFGALLFVMFAYAGTSVIAMAAAETRSPERTIPRAIHLVVVTVLALYLSSIVAITLLIPPGQVGTGISPFVQALDRLHLSRAASLMNLVILTAALSSMNSALYGVTRMLHALSERGDAPRRLAKVNRRGVPTSALLVSGVALGLTISLAYLLPKTAYVLISGATSLVAMFNWGLIALTHLRFRAKERPNAAPFRAWGHPWTSYLAFALVVLVAASAWFLPSQRVGLTGLMLLLVFFSVVYWVLVRRK